MTMSEGSMKMVVMMTVRNPVVNLIFVAGTEFCNLNTVLGTASGETLFPMINICAVKCEEGVHSFKQDLMMILIFVMMMMLKAKIKNPSLGTK